MAAKVNEFKKKIRATIKMILFFKISGNISLVSKQSLTCKKPLLSNSWAWIDQAKLSWLTKSVKKPNSTVPNLKPEFIQVKILTFKPSSIYLVGENIDKIVKE